MAHNPVQVVLNTKDYFEVPDQPPGGSRKDFFADRDTDFVVHKSRLLKQISSIGAVLRQSGEQSAFVKVALQKEALAKSHRPVRSLFPEDEFPTVGAGKLGELYYHVSANGLNQIQSRINKAELETRKKRTKEGRLQPSPSQARSEVGAIKSISIPSASDKRSFSVEEALTWLHDKRTAGFYIVQLFDVPAERKASFAIADNLEHLRGEFINGLVSLRLGIEMYPFAPRDERIVGKFGNTFLMRLTKASPAIAASKLQKWNSEGTPHAELDLARQHHERFLNFLDQQPIVRRMTLSPIVVSSKTAGSVTGKAARIPKMETNVTYPRIGIVDGGVSDVLSTWIIGRNELVAAMHQDTSHGTFVAGLLIAGRTLNSDEVAREADGCQIYDIGLLPDENITGAFGQYYPRGILGFLDELESSVTEAAQNRVRVFNMSLNLQDPVEEEQYSPFASILDKIADQNDALFVISAGNLDPSDLRPVWPADCKEALRQLAQRTSSDTIFQPAESARSVSVGALNPPDTLPCVAGAPANYSRRGPGLKVGVKPDFAHYGGSLKTRSMAHHGLFSIASDGNKISDAGTSYSAPLVAKTLATLDAGIDGRVARETLVGLCVHHAETPSILAVEELQDITRQFIGFGVPPKAADMLTTEDSRITLVFSDVLRKDHELRFGFVWPKSLTTDSGSCRGNVKMTLVYRPPLDERFGSEFVRINLDAYLRQESTKDGRFHGRLHQIFLPKGASDAQFESEQIEHGLKWWPTKVYERSFPKGVGNSSNWRIVVDSIRRDAQIFPMAGVPFSLVVTISDLDGEAPVFQELRQNLRARNVKIADIKVAGRVRLRG